LGVIDGKAVSCNIRSFRRSWKKGQHGWKITGTTTAEIGDRNVTFDLQGFARGNWYVDGT